MRVLSNRPVKGNVVRILWTTREWILAKRGGDRKYLIMNAPVGTVHAVVTI
jgi:hypothetical protein